MSATGRGAVREPDDYYTTPSWCVRRRLEAWNPPTWGDFAEPGAGNGAVIRAVNATLKRRLRWDAFEVREEERTALEHATGGGGIHIGDFLRADLVPFPAV